MLCAGQGCSGGAVLLWSRCQEAIPVIPKRRIEVFHLLQRVLLARWPIWLQCVTVRASARDWYGSLLTLIGVCRGAVQPSLLWSGIESSSTPMLLW